MMKFRKVAYQFFRKFGGQMEEENLLKYQYFISDAKTLIQDPFFKSFELPHVYCQTFLQLINDCDFLNVQKNFKESVNQQQLQASLLDLLTLIIKGVLETLRIAYYEELEFGSLSHSGEAMKIGTISSTHVYDTVFSFLLVHFEFMRHAIKH